MKSITCFILYLTLTASVFGQETFKVMEGSSITVQGTSTLHDWELTSSSIEGTAQFIVKKDEAKDLTSASLSLTVETLKSGKSGLDKNAYKAMKVESFPTITYTMTSATSSTSDSGTQFNIDGVMNIAGIEKQISMSVICNVLDDKIICSGEQGMQMTTYEIDPPTALFGTVKAEDEVTMLCDITFVR